MKQTAINIIQYKSISGNILNFRLIEGHFSKFMIANSFYFTPVYLEGFVLS